MKTRYYLTVVETRRHIPESAAKTIIRSNGPWGFREFLSFDSSEEMERFLQSQPRAEHEWFRWQDTKEQLLSKDLPANLKPASVISSSGLSASEPAPFILPSPSSIEPAE